MHQNHLRTYAQIGMQTSVRLFMGGINSELHEFTDRYLAVNRSKHDENNATEQEHPNKNHPHRNPVEQLLLADK